MNILVGSMSIMLPCGTGISLFYALYTSNLICDCFCPFFFYNFLNLVLKRQIKTVRCQHLLTLFAIFFMRAILKGLTFGLRL